MKKQIILLSLLLASHICAKIITVENNTGKDITVIIGNGYLKMKKHEIVDVEIGKKPRGLSSSISEEEPLKLPYGIEIKWTTHQKSEMLEKFYIMSDYAMKEPYAKPTHGRPLSKDLITFYNIEKIILGPGSEYSVELEIRPELTLTRQLYKNQLAKEEMKPPLNLKKYKKLKVIKKTSKKEVLVKNETDDVIAFKVALEEEEFSPLQKGLEKDIAIEKVPKGVGPIMWQTLSQTKHKQHVYYQMLPHKNITSVTLKPYGKYDVETEKTKPLGFGTTTKIFENQAADINIGEGKQGIHIYNATGKLIQLLFKGWKKWGALRPKEEIFIETTGIKKDRHPFLRWSPEPEIPTVQEYRIYPDKKIKTENIKSFVLKPNGIYDISLKQKKNVTKTIENKKAKEEKIQRKSVELKEIEIL
ncbi:hypothetical protein ACFLYA_01170 [Candidatus Dependentiae bacterium]